MTEDSGNEKIGFDVKNVECNESDDNIGGISMNQRFRITRSMQENITEQAITLEECKDYFATKPDFTYTEVFTVKGTESTMSIKGDFFMWKHEDLEIPFRLYMGDIYVAVANEAVIPKMLEISSDLRADVVEG